MADTYSRGEDDYVRFCIEQGRQAIHRWEGSSRIAPRKRCGEPGASSDAVAPGTDLPAFIGGSDA
jgi:hypothetical protein